MRRGWRQSWERLELVTGLVAFGRKLFLKIVGYQREETLQF